MTRDRKISMNKIKEKKVKIPNRSIQQLITKIDKSNLTLKEFSSMESHRGFDVGVLNFIFS